MKKYRFSNPCIQISPTDIVNHMLASYVGDKDEVLMVGERMNVGNVEGEELIELFNENDPDKSSNWDFQLLDALENLYDLETVIVNHFLED